MYYSSFQALSLAQSGTGKTRFLPICVGHGGIKNFLGFLFLPEKMLSFPRKQIYG
jgi:hypothetical protein